MGSSKVFRSKNKCFSTLFVDYCYLINSCLPILIVFPPNLLIQRTGNWVEWLERNNFILQLQIDMEELKKDLFNSGGNIIKILYLLSSIIDWSVESWCYIHPYMILLIAEIITQSINLLRDIPDRTCYWYIRSGWQESQAGLLPKKSWSFFLCFSQLLLFCCVWCPPNFCQRKELFGFLCER